MASACQAAAGPSLRCRTSQACSADILLDRARGTASTTGSSPGGGDRSVASTSSAARGGGSVVHILRRRTPAASRHHDTRRSFVCSSPFLRGHRGSLFGGTSHVTTNACRAAVHTRLLHSVDTRGSSSSSSSSMVLPPSAASRRRTWSSSQASSSSSSSSSPYSTILEAGGDAAIAPQQIPYYEEGDLERPIWVGEQRLSRLINSVLSIDPIFNLLQSAARRFIIHDAEKSSIPWRESVSAMAQSRVYEEKAVVEDKSLAYPAYYLERFHGYLESNLSWKAAFEVEAATLVMARRSMRTLTPQPSPEEAERVLRRNWLTALRNHVHVYGSGRPVTDILDVGCATGISSEHLANSFPNAQVMGLDPSPYFLAVASYKQKQAAMAGRVRSKPIRWVHAFAEDSHLPPRSFDIVTLCFLVHELPAAITRSILRESHRVLRPGGTIVVTDTSPRSKALQRLPTAIAVFLKSTEPFIDEYFQLDMRKEMEEAGFTSVVSVMTCPRHSTITATAA